MLNIENLVVEHKNFRLNEVNLSVKKGTIVGLVGLNGAGKTTIFSSVFDLVPVSGGNITVFGKPHKKLEAEDKAKMATVINDMNVFAFAKVPKVNKTMKDVFSTWNEKVFMDYVQKFSLPVNKQINTYSAGMKMKLWIAIALSHDAQLLLLDEPTVGLDPLARDEILDVLRNYVLDGERAMLISSHITTDLEKLCDYIAFLRGGSIVEFEEKDVLLEKYRLLKCTKEQFESVSKEAVVGYRATDFYIEALVYKNMVNSGFTLERPTLETIAVYLLKDAEA